MARSGRRRAPITTGGAALTAGTWGLGVAIGVALGGWLTATSGSGAPGAAALDVPRDLVLVPLASGALVFALVFLALILFGLVLRSRATAEVDDRE